MEEYAKILTYAIPGFLVLISIEWIVGYYKGIQTNRVFDTVSSLSSGVTNTIKEILGIALIIISYSFMVDHISIFNIENTILVYVLAFIGIDFAGYWTHRWEHEINIFWNRHVIHHSSEEFNLSCALRQNISAIVAIFFFLYIPLALIGIPAEVIAIIAPLHLFAQFWYHTRIIDKMGILEHVIVTPSHHRVHHAINPEYIDKNYGQIFILWDKWFGTFQQELQSVPAVYGVKKPVATWNPIWINYQHILQLCKDAWHTESWWDKVRIWWMPTGWRPTDVKSKYPIEIKPSPYDQIKYDTNPSAPFNMYAIFQLFFTLMLMLSMFSMIGTISFFQLCIGGLFLLLSVASYTSIMDRASYAMLIEVIKVGLGIVILSQHWIWSSYTTNSLLGHVFILYLVLSLLSSIYFDRQRSQYFQQQVSNA